MKFYGAFKNSLRNAKSLKALQVFCARTSRLPPAAEGETGRAGPQAGGCGAAVSADEAGLSLPFHGLFCEMTVSVSVFLSDLLFSCLFSGFTPSHRAHLSCSLPLACLSPPPPPPLSVPLSGAQSPCLTYISVCPSPSLPPQTESSHFPSFDRSI